MIWFLLKNYYNSALKLLMCALGSGWGMEMDHNLENLRKYC